MILAFLVPSLTSELFSGTIVCNSFSSTSVLIFNWSSPSESSLISQHQILPHSHSESDTDIDSTPFYRIKWHISLGLIMYTKFLFCLPCAVVFLHTCSLGNKEISLRITLTLWMASWLFCFPSSTRVNIHRDNYFTL